MCDVKKIVLFFLLLAPLASTYAVCQKCERVREENARKAKEQNWEFYEDWQEMQKDGSESAAVSSKNTVKNKANERGEKAPN